MAEEAKKEDKEIKEGKLFAILGYLSILCLVPLLLKKDNKFATYHGKQGLILFIWLVAASIVAPIPLLGWVIWIVSAILIVALSAIGIIQVLMGKFWKIPYISNIASKISI
jgi:uncharacterized membrane protein